MINTNKITNQNQKCIEACNSCEKACLEGIKLCLTEFDVPLDARIECIEMLYRCSSICKQASYFMSMDSKAAKEICMLCAAICEDTASKCYIFKKGIYVTSADSCESCANECRIMAS